VLWVKALCQTSAEYIGQRGANLDYFAKLHILCRFFDSWVRDHGARATPALVWTQCAQVVQRLRAAKQPAGALRDPLSHLLALRL
jgi:hypothetical protein